MKLPLVQFSKVKIENSGIDYNPATTTAKVNPIGSGAVVEAVVETYRFDRVKQIQDDPVLDFDDHSGFLYSDGEKLSRYGYTISPKKLREELGDTDDTKHSPILGWAYDGNPIYGPFGYKNKFDDGDGIIRMLSGYKLLGSRNVTIPFGYDEGDKLVAFDPPA